MEHGNYKNFGSPIGTIPLVKAVLLNSANMARIWRENEKKGG